MREMRKSKVLHARVSASPYDEHYEMAFVYCVDVATKYCFSLTRLPDQGEIEVMVLDQLNASVEDLNLTLNGDVLTAHLDPETASQLDGFDEYVVNLGVSHEERRQLITALKKIFEGKRGFRVESS